MSEEALPRVTIDRRPGGKALYAAFLHADGGITRLPNELGDVLLDVYTELDRLRLENAHLRVDFETLAAEVNLQ